MLAILDYEAGNQTSVFRALQSLGISSVITADKKILETSDGVIFPGVGAAGQAMAHLEHTGLKEELYTLVKQGKPLLGVCLGCQILLDRSEEDGGIHTLGILSGECLRFNKSLQDEEGNSICIPHMGWNNIAEKRKSILLEGIPDNAEFYFVHSYYTKPSKDLVIATTYHGMEFCSIFGRDGLWAVQFHPEKSGSHGLKLLKNFDTYCHSQKK